MPKLTFLQAYAACERYGDLELWNRFWDWAVNQRFEEMLANYETQESAWIQHRQQHTENGHAEIQTGTG